MEDEKTPSPENATTTEPPTAATPPPFTVTKEAQEWFEREWVRRMDHHLRIFKNLEAKARQFEDKYVPPDEQLGKVAAALMAQNEVQREIAAQTARTTRHSNAYTPEISVFSYPEGDTEHKKPMLCDEKGRPRDTYFCGTRQEESLLTPAEIIAFNRITTTKQSRGGAWRADIQFAGKDRERLMVFVPNASLNERMELPSGLQIILLELESGPGAVDPLRLTEEIQQLKDQLAILLKNQQVAA